MAPKIFLTGGTGYIGGSVLHTIATAHPEYSITILLRNVPESFSSKYPNISIVKGDYESSDLLSNEAEKADIVVHSGNSDHVASLNAIIAGLLRRSTPGYLLHLSGTGIVSDWAEDEYLGKLNPKIWSDVDSLDEIRALPDLALHRTTEKMLHDTIHEHPSKINIAIMCPPDIYGRGHGPAKTQSALVPIYVKEIQDSNGKPFYCADGTNTRSWVHMNDLMRLYLHVVEAAASNRNAATYFNNNGYYFAGTQEHSQIDVARATGAVLQKQGIISTAEPVSINLETVDGMANTYFPGFPKLARYLFASNSRTSADRAEKLFGYKAEAPGLMEMLESDILDVVNAR